MPQGMERKGPHFWGPFRMNTVANEQRTRGAKGRQGRSGGRRAGQSWGRQRSLVPTPAQGSGASAHAEAMEGWLTGGLHLPPHHVTDGKSSHRDGFPCSLSLAGSRIVREGWTWCHCPYPGDSEETGSPVTQALRPRRQELLGCSFH